MENVQNAQEIEYIFLTTTEHQISYNVTRNLLKYVTSTLPSYCLPEVPSILLLSG